MKVRLTIYITLALIIISLTIFGVYKFFTRDLKPNFEIVYDTTFVGDDGLACLTFYRDGKYSMYDCDSEPTRYFFDSENECSYKYEKEYMKFKCKYNYSNIKDRKIKIINWDYKEFRFIYNGDEKTFYAR